MAPWQSLVEHEDWTGKKCSTIDQKVITITFELNENAAAASFNWFSQMSAALFHLLTYKLESAVFIDFRTDNFITLHQVVSNDSWRGVMVCCFVACYVLWALQSGNYTNMQYLGGKKMFPCLHLWKIMSDLSSMTDDGRGTSFTTLFIHERHKLFQLLCRLIEH